MAASSELWLTPQQHSDLNSIAQSHSLWGVKALGLPMEVRGITPIRWDYDLRTDVARNSNRLSKLLNVQLQISHKMF